MKNYRNVLWQVTKAIENKADVLPPLRVPNSNARYTTNSDKANAIVSCFVKSHHITHQWNCPQTEQQQLWTNCEPVNIQSTQFKYEHSHKYLHIPHKTKWNQENWKKKKKKKKGKKERKKTLITLTTQFWNTSRKTVVQLSQIFNACFNFGYFPNTWKNAKVIALPKPHKDYTLPCNYRPISLLSSISEILERIILLRLKLHMEEFIIIPDIQFGFRQSHSVHQLARVVNELKNAQIQK